MKRRSLRALLAVVVTAVCVAFGGQAMAAESPTCPNAGVFSGGIVSKVCWDCFFPMRFGGAANYATMPLGSAAPVCTCPGRAFGYPTEGPTLGIWMPSHMIELVRHPYCSVALGAQLSGGSSGPGTGVSNLINQGGYGDQSPKDQGQTLYHMHYFNFPISQILDQLVDAVCVSHAGSDMDLTYFSEIDPTWSNDSLSLQLHPEAALFNNAAGIAACLIDAAAAAVGQPIPEMIWCAGAWGTLFPETGHVEGHSSPQQNASLDAARGLALLHERGLALKTYGDDAVCHAIPFPVLPKNQYKLQTMHPMAETLSNHWIGANTFKWGEWRHQPQVGEDFLYLVWNWTECCGNP